MRTLAALTDPRKRPREPRSPLDEDLLTHDPVIPYMMDMKKLLANVRSARRGAAPGPSGMTVEHLRPLLESDRDSWALAVAKARDATNVLQASVELAWFRRWSSILSCAAVRAFPDSLLEVGVAGGAGGDVPSSDDVVWDNRF